MVVARKTGPALKMDVGSVMRKGVEGIGPLRGKELTMAILFVAQVVLWMAASAVIGLGGATILIVFFILVTKLMTWEDDKRRTRK